MRRTITRAALAASLMATLGVTGCEKPASKPKDAKPAATSEAPKSEDEKIAAAIAELPEAERAAATAQKMCPVGNAPLGSMGMPYKVSVKGRDVYLCCEGCQGPLEKDPEKYFAILDGKK